MEEARNVIQEAEAEAGETHAEVGTAQRFEGVEGAINVSIVAFSIVFGVLIVLTAMIYAVRIFAAEEDEEPQAKNEKKNDVKPQPAAAVKAAPVQAVAAAPVVNASAAAPAVVNASVSASPQTKIVAAITAAIMAATKGTGQIVSIQPALALPEAAASKNAPSFGSSAWKTSGRIALVHNRLTRTWR